MDKSLIDRRCRIKNSGSEKVYRIVGFSEVRAGFTAYVKISFDGIVQTVSMPLDRLEILPIAQEPHAKAAAFGVSLDPMRVDHDEATELCAHMLGLAHMYFQATPDDARDEVVRIIAKREGPSPNGSVMIGAMAAFDSWHAHYERLKEDD